jgi:hypothetical protein
MSLAAIKEFLKITDPEFDAELEALEESAREVAQDYCGRVFRGGTFTETHEPRAIVFVDQYPITNVTEVRVGERELNDDEFRYHADRGAVEFIVAPRESVRITYTVAESWPPTVERAILELVSHWYRESKTAAQLSHVNQHSTADGTTYPWSQATGYRLPPTVLKFLDLHRHPSI